MKRELTPEESSRINRIMEGMRNAKPEPSVNCTDGEHNFEHRLHGDGSKSYFNLFECTKCGEFVKQVHERTGDDALLWAEE